jgi:hypothetical protein
MLLITSFEDVQIFSRGRVIPLPIESHLGLTIDIEQAEAQPHVKTLGQAWNADCVMNVVHGSFRACLKSKSAF